MRNTERRLEFDERLKVKRPSVLRRGKTLRTLAILGVSAAISAGVERVHVDIQTRNAPATADTSRVGLKAGIFGLPELSITIDDENTDPEIQNASDDSEELTLDPSKIVPPTSPLIACPDEFPICNVEYVNGFPVCPPFDEPCKNALVDYFGAYAKENKPAQPTTPTGPTIFDPYGVMRRAREELNNAVKNVKKVGESVVSEFKNWNHRGRLTVTPPSKSSTASNAEKNKTNEKSPHDEKLLREYIESVVPVYMAAMSEDRSEALTPEQIKIIFGISKDLANEDFVKELIEATGLSCDEIIENTTRFVNEQLDDTTSQISQAVEKNKLLIMYMAVQLGMSKIPNSNMWQWIKIPESLVKKEVCGE